MHETHLRRTHVKLGLIMEWIVKDVMLISVRDIDASWCTHHSPIICVETLHKWLIVENSVALNQPTLFRYSFFTIHIIKLHILFFNEIKMWQQLLYTNQTLTACGNETRKRYDIIYTPVWQGEVCVSERYARVSHGYEESVMGWWAIDGLETESIESHGTGASEARREWLVNDLFTRPKNWIERVEVDGGRCRRDKVSSFAIRFQFNNVTT